MAFEVPPLPYDYAALEPHIDEATMKLHHDKHHAAYVAKLNGAVEKHPELGKQTPEEIIKNLSKVPEDVRTVVRNNGGGQLLERLVGAGHVGGVVLVVVELHDLSRHVGLERGVVVGQWWNFESQSVSS